jgi:UDP-2-acetamido-3-amino-2,3-dideoxy-glucuronate N-acetyltransferase
MERQVLGIAVTGVGSWGANLVKAFSQVDRTRIVALCDARLDRLAPYRALPDRPLLTQQFSEVLRTPTVSAVVIATPPDSHAGLALRALRAGRHVFVEKPLALCCRDAQRLKQASRTAKRQLMVGHLLEYHPAFEGLLRLVESGRLGRISHVLSQRLGPRRRCHQNAWWTLAPHDLSMLRALFRCDPVDLTVRPRCSASIDAVVAQLAFPDGCTARVEVSAVDAEKIRRLTVVGAKGLALFDDTEPEHKLRIFRQRARLPGGQPIASPVNHQSPNRLPSLLGFSSSAVDVETEEPLQREARHFVSAILDGARIRTDVDSGLAVVRLLELGERSLHGGGRFTNHQQRSVGGPARPQP